jgi:4-carboxymuconolactone decarboxylase
VIRQRANGAPRNDSVTDGESPPVTMTPSLDEPTRRLVRLAAVISGGSEAQLRAELAAVIETKVDIVWVEEVILQSYLFAGFPRGLNAAREWRRLSGVAAPAADRDAHHENGASWEVRGEVTCATVYGPFYEKLRKNIRALHPALDAWMIVEGYGKVLGRPQLDLVRRELCVVAACAIGRQDRQLHSHLHGALHVGATPAAVEGTLHAIADLITADDRERYALLWNRVLAMAATPADAPPSLH